MPKIKDDEATTAPAPSGGSDAITYPEVQLHAAVGDDALDAEQARDLLGWEAETDTVKFGSSYLLTDEEGKKVRCLKNLRNRPLNTGNVEALKQEILNRRWRFNGEPIIVGQTGTLLNGQHTLIALVLADQVRKGNQSEHWDAVWGDDPLRIDKAIVFGVVEDDSIINTMDTCKPRTLADVLYRSPYFADKKEGDRKKLASILDHAVRMMWSRTGAGIDAFAPRRTHAEALAFIDAHPSLLKCVKHVYEEESEGSVTHFLSLGYMAALVYLMGASEANREKYEDGGRTEQAIGKLKRLNDACDYVTMLAGGSAEVKAVRDGINALVDPETGVYIGSLGERIAIIVKGWNAYAVRGKATPKDVALDYTQDEDGYRVLNETPTLGGIDVGDPTGARDRVEAGGDDTPEPEYDEEEIEDRKAKVKRESLDSKRDQPESPSAEDTLERLRNEHPGYTLVFVGKTTCNLFGADAEYAVRKWKVKVKTVNDVKVTGIPASTLDERVATMQADGRKVALVHPGPNGDTDVTVDRLKAGKSPAKPKK